MVGAKLLFMSNFSIFSISTVAPMLVSTEAEEFIYLIEN